jgi:ribosomal protein S18 acetylase RimI-like enzyme
VIVLRPAHGDDTPALVALLHATFLDTWAPEMSADSLARWHARDDGPEAYVRDKGAEFVVAEVDGALAGMIHWHEGFVHALHVDAAYRRLGIGAALMAEAERATRAAGLPHLRLETDTFNGPSQALYRRLGFVEIDRYPDTQYDPRIVTVLLEKRL